MKKLIYATAAIVLGLFIFLRVSSDEPKTSTKNEDNYLTPATSLRDAHGLAVDVKDSTKLWIASHTGLNLLKDEKNLYLVGSGRDDYMGFSPHPTDPSIFFASGHPSMGGNLGFQKSIDAGKTWQKISDGLNGPVDFHSMAVDRINPDIIYGFYGGRMQKTTDGGKTWEYVDSAPGNIIQLAAGTRENTVYVATVNGLEVSRDQGGSWASLSTELTGEAVTSIGVNPKDQNELLVYSQKLGLARTTDGGNNWTKTNTPFTDEMVMYTAYDSNNPSVAYILTRSLAIYKTADSGNTWKKVR